MCRISKRLLQNSFHLFASNRFCVCTVYRYIECKGFTLRNMFLAKYYTLEQPPSTTCIQVYLRCAVVSRNVTIHLKSIIHLSYHDQNVYIYFYIMYTQKTYVHYCCCSSYRNSQVRSPILKKLTILSKTIPHL